jgi:hypothetical protein
VATRDEIRKATLGRSRKLRSKVVNVDGVEIEVRQPTVRGRSEIMRRAKAMGGDTDRVDIGEMQVTAMIECCYVPGTSDRVFGDTDRDALLDAPSGAYDELATVAMELMNVDREDVAKNSAGTRAASSSSPSLAS